MAALADASCPLKWKIPLSTLHNENIAPRALIGKTAIWFWVLLATISIPMIVSYFLNLWRLEHYQFFPFALVAIFWLARTRMNRANIQGPRNFVAGSLVAVSVAIATFAIVVGSPWVNAISLVLLGITFFYSQSDESGKSLIGLSVPLLMLIRLPLGLDQLFVIKLQRITTQLSSVFLDLLAIPHSTETNAIQLANRELFVAEACSGIQSVFTLAFVACLFIAVNRRGLWLLPLYVLVAIVLAVVGNVLRVTTIVAMEVWLNFDVTDGWRHATVGYASLLFAIAILWSFENLILTLFHGISRSRRGWDRNPFIGLFNKFAQDFVSESDQGESTSVLRAKDRRVTLMEGILLGKSARVSGIVFCLFLTIFSLATASELKIPGFGLPGGFMDHTRILNPSKSIFDNKLEYLEIVSHERSRDNENPRLGRNADVWNFRLNDLGGQIVLSQTYHGWHEFCLCYGNDEWNLLTRETLEKETPSDDGILDASPTPIAYARFRKNHRQEGYLFYSAVYGDGKFVYPPPQAGRLDAKFNTLIDAPAESMAMMQIWVTTDQKLNTQVLRAFREDFFRIRKEISAACREKDTQANVEDRIINTDEKGAE